MSKINQYTSVWDAIEDDPIRQENLKLRSILMMELSERIKAQELTQAQAAKVLHITQPRISALLKGKINDFRLDSLVDMAHRLGMQVTINVAA
jgi:predicted XRE-type DNA-binding protein